MMEREAAVVAAGSAAVVAQVEAGSAAVVAHVSDSLVQPAAREVLAEPPVSAPEEASEAPRARW